MSDRFSKDVRSSIMRNVKPLNTKPELKLRHMLFAAGFRYRIHRKDLPGRPDIVLPRYRTVIFVHGCFWHQHLGCKHFRMPVSNVAYWQNKLSANKIRDMKVNSLLTDLGWRVIVVWECEIKAVESIHLIPSLNFLFTPSIFD